VWKHRRPKLPNPIVPIFPQRVVLSDGSSFTHYTTSPRSRIRLTRDLTNNPLWNYGMSKGGLFEDEEGSSGRMGRFRRKFEEFSSNLDWVAEEGEVTSELVEEDKTH
jgi:Ribosomal protein L31p, N-terminal